MGATELDGTVGLLAANSLDYVRAVFSLYDRRQPFVPVRSRETAASLPGLSIADFVEPGSATGWFAERHAPAEGDAVAQVNYTSGTTGTPKGILLTHDALADTVGRLVDATGLDSGAREYVGVPPVYSFGLGRFRACAAVGAEAYLPPRGFDPVELAAMLAEGRVNALSAVPSLLRVLIGRPAIVGAAGPRMRWIEIGSQPMAAAEKKAVRELFPNARIVQHYGLTEASRTTFLDITDADDAALASVGRPTGRVELDIAADGRVRIRGRHVARAFLTPEGPRPLVDAEDWLTTNDLGRLEGGNLVFEGRADDLINCAGVKIVPDVVEARLRERTGMATGIAVARIPDERRGDGVVVAAEPSAVGDEALRADAEHILAELGAAIGDSLYLLRPDRLPVTETGKVRRAELARLAQKRIAAETPAAATIDEATRPVLAAFASAFPRRRVRPEDSFVALGGDSLAHVGIEAALADDGPLPHGWHEMTVEELERLHAAAARPKTASRWSLRAVNTEVVLRACAIVSIVAHHAYLRDLGGGIDTLLLLIGLNLARFQRGRLVSESRWKIVGEVLTRIVLPYYCLLLVFAARYRWVDWTDFLLVSNFEGRIGSFLTPYWFVQAYLQTVVVLVACASLPPLGRMIAHRPLRFGTLFLAAALIAKIAAMAAFGHAWLLSRTPDQFLYLIALGWCIHEARGARGKAALLLVAAGIAALDSWTLTPLWVGFDGVWHGLSLLVAVAMLVLTTTVRVPQPLRLVFVEIAVASFVIYLTHPVMLFLLGHSPFAGRPLIAVLLILAAGVAISAGIGALSRRYGHFVERLPGAWLVGFGRAR